MRSVQAIGQMLVRVVCPFRARKNGEAILQEPNGSMRLTFGYSTWVYIPASENLHAGRAVWWSLARTNAHPECEVYPAVMSVSFACLACLPRVSVSRIRLRMR